jgi:DNA-binding Lrp family transcriptional regulator
MLSRGFSIDEIDKNIIELIQENPNLTHVEIGRKVKRSQPIVGMRIKKLEEAGILTFQAGINIKNADLVSARVDMITTNPEEIEDIVAVCPYMTNGFRHSGEYNFSIILLGFEFKELDHIVNKCFRTNPYVETVIMNAITNVVKDFVLPFNVSCKGCENACDKFHCFEENGGYNR